MQLAIYSPADRLQPHRYKADESYECGGAEMTPVQCYLDVEGIIAIAKDTGCDVIHPGYGFLSENATFARRCAEEGITFVGPLPETIDVRRRAGYAYQQRPGKTCLQRTLDYHAVAHSQPAIFTCSMPHPSIQSFTLSPLTCACGADHG